MLTGEIPVVLRREIYALAALTGAAVIAAGVGLGAPDLPVLVGSAAVTCLIRLAALRRDWSAPPPRSS
jgi:uncharacterized membrane protein YeiH